jgi:hypothetical protein
MSLTRRHVGDTPMEHIGDVMEKGDGGQGLVDGIGSTSVVEAPNTNLVETMMQERYEWRQDMLEIRNQLEATRNGIQRVYETGGEVIFHTYAGDATTPPFKIVNYNYNRRRLHIRVEKGAIVFGSDPNLSVISSANSQAGFNGFYLLATAGSPYIDIFSVRDIWAIDGGVAGGFVISTMEEFMPVDQEDRKNKR